MTEPNGTYGQCTIHKQNSINSADSYFDPGDYDGIYTDGKVGSKILEYFLNCEAAGGMIKCVEISRVNEPRKIQ